MHAFSSLDIDVDWHVMSLTSNNIYVFECFIFFIVKKKDKWVYMGFRRNSWLRGTGQVIYNSNLLILYQSQTHDRMG